jgi:non-specific serine/threonine protein kinase
MTDTIARVNQALHGRYSIEREVGSGGMATVYLARDLRHQRPVAIKVLRPELAAGVGPERFLREITTTANLRHPHILPLYDSGEADGLLYYVMPFVEGETLRDRMDRETQLPLADVLRLAGEVAEALAFAHEHGVVHRDVKPENILLEDGRAVVADFGIASALSGGAPGAPGENQDRLTRTGSSVGTPQYMSPEQASGEEVDGRSDLYALACVVYEMLAGDPPFTGRSWMAVIARHLTDPVPDISTVRPAVPSELVALLESGLAKAAADRTPTMDVWRQGLGAVLAALDGPGADQAAGPERIYREPPAPPTDLIGREEQLGTALDRLADGVRVLTLTGVGGTGKTRFSIELFRRYGDRCPGGAAFISLASVTAPDQVLPTVAAALELAEAHGRTPLDALVTLLGDRHVLLVLDNFEQVVDAAGDVAALVARCPGIQVVTTSRRPLKIGAEVEFSLPPLELPDAADQGVEALSSCPSVALFVERARKVKADFHLTAENAPAVSGICRSLDGLPLALELAAARVRVLEPAALLQRLDHALDLLTSGDRDLPVRQRTLRATISWSYSLLNPEEQRLLRYLSTFQEGWTLEAMEQVCYDEADRWRALDELDSLVEKGLVRVMDGGARFSLLETIRAFAAEQLHAGAQVEAARNAHAAFFMEFARGVDAGILGDTQVASMERARMERANTFAALAWLVLQARNGDLDAVENGQRMCGWLGWYWHIAGLHLVAEESLDTLQSLSAKADTGPTLGRVLSYFASGMVAVNTGDPQRAFDHWAVMAREAEALGELDHRIFGLAGMGYAALGMGKLTEAAEALDTALELTRSCDRPFFIALTSSLSGMLRFMTGRGEEGMALVEKARQIAVAQDDCENSGMALSFLASMHFSRGDAARAVELYQEAERYFIRVGDKPEAARIQCETGYTELASGQTANALRHFQRALRTYDEVGSPRGTGQALMGLAATEAAMGNPDRALTLATAADALSQRAGVVVDYPMAPGVEDRIEALKASIPRDELEALVASGSALTPAEALALVAQ